MQYSNQIYSLSKPKEGDFEVTEVVDQDQNDTETDPATQQTQGEEEVQIIKSVVDEINSSKKRKAQESEQAPAKKKAKVEEQEEEVVDKEIQSAAVQDEQYVLNLII